MFRSKSRTRLFSILAVAAMAFAISTDVQPRTRTGGAAGSGSDWNFFIKLFDEDTAITFPSTNFGNGYFDTNATTPGFVQGMAVGGTIDCEYTPNPTVDDPDPATIPALCRASVSCEAWEVANCSAKGGKNASGQRVSKMTCPIGGCTGVLDVWELDGVTPIRLNIAIGGDVSGFSRQDCFAEFPGGLLKRGDMGEITTFCTKGAAFSADDPVISQLATGLRNYFSLTSWFDAIHTTCRSDNNSIGACPNDGGLWIVVNPLLTGPIDAESCAAAGSTLRCGQFVDADDVLQFGPTPLDYSAQGCSLNSSGECECRCPNCDPATGAALVNVSTSGAGQYAIVSEDPAAAAACPVTITGNP